MGDAEVRRWLDGTDARSLVPHPQIDLRVRVCSLEPLVLMIVDQLEQRDSTSLIVANGIIRGLRHHLAVQDGDVVIDGECSTELVGVDLCAGEVLG